MNNTAMAYDTETDWVDLARNIAAEFATDIAERTRERASPTPQIERLKQSRLSSLIVAAENGGPGVAWSTALRTVREIAAGDGSVGLLYGYHLLNLVNIRREPVERWRGHEREVLAERLWLAGLINPRDPGIRFTPDGNGYRLDGQKSFCSGAAFADRLSISGVRTDTDESIFAYIPADRPGIRYADDWDHFGVERSESGSFTVENTPVAADEVVIADIHTLDNPSEALRTPVNQSVFTQFYLGFALGALRAAGTYVREKKRGWAHGGAEKPSDDPLIIREFGDLWIRLQAATALADRAGSAIEALLARNGDLTPAERGEAAVEVAAAKVAAAEAGLAVTSRVFDVMGARATHNRYAFDRFWRDVRTHTLHDPLPYKVLEVGRYVLNEEYPTVRAYT